MEDARKSILRAESCLLPFRLVFTGLRRSDAYRFVAGSLFVDGAPSDPGGREADFSGQILGTILGTREHSAGELTAAVGNFARQRFAAWQRENRLIA